MNDENEKLYKAEDPEILEDEEKAEAKDSGSAFDLFNLLSEYSRIIKIPNIFINWISLSLLLTFVSTWLFILPLFLQRLGANDGQVGTAYLFFIMSFSVFQILGGFISDKIGRKKLLTYPSILLPLVYIAAAFSRHWIPVMAFLTVGNLIQGLQIPAIYSLMAESVPEEDRGKSFSIMEISISMGYTIGPFIGAVLLKSNILSSIINSIPIKILDPVQFMILLTGIALIPVAFLRFFLKDTTVHEDYEVSFGDIVKAFTGNLVILLVVFIFFGLMIDTTFYGPFIALFAKEKLGMTEDSILRMFMFAGLFALFFNLVSGKITEKIGSKKAMVIGTLGHALLFIPWFLSQKALTAMIVFVPSYLFLQLAYIAHDTIMSDVTDIKTRSTIVGIFFTVPGILGALAPKLGAYLIKPFGLASPFVLGIVFAIITAILLSFVKTERN